MVALRFEPGAGLPLASSHATVESALAQGAWDEFRDPTRRVKDIVELEDGEDPLEVERKSLITRKDVQRELAAARADFKRSQEPGGFHYLTSEESWMNREVG